MSVLGEDIFVEGLRPLLLVSVQAGFFLWTRVAPRSYFRGWHYFIHLFHGSWSIWGKKKGLSNIGLEQRGYLFLFVCGGPFRFASHSSPFRLSGGFEGTRGSGHGV